ncbi:MAG: hypothetical protein IPG50_30710 [Myxococcales bacterium]|nr:hypothetical protein [Myxococcales bacterium]
MIQVVDISDAGGKLVKGADVAVAGQIQSRWQMDEHAGGLARREPVPAGRGRGQQPEGPDLHRHERDR